MSSLLRRAGDHALTVGALLGVAALLSALLGAALGVRPLFFRSGSMAPTIGTGSMALAHSVPAGDLRAGDVVSVVTSSGSRVTHRVVETRSESGHTVLTLRGDANRVADPEPYVVDSAYRVFWHVPRAGYAAGAMLTPAGLFLLGVGVTGLLALALGRRGPRASRPGGGRRARRPAPHRHRARRAGATAVATMAVVAGPAGPAVSAPWTDDVVVTGTALTTATVPPSASFRCGTVGVLSVTFDWDAVPGATSYTLHYGLNGSSILVSLDTTETILAAITGGTAWVVANRNFGSVTWSSLASNTRTYTVALASVCS